MAEQQKQKVAFEAWAKSENMSIAWGVTNYLFSETAKAWKAWQHLSHAGGEPVAYRYRVKGQDWEVFDENPCLDGHGPNEEVEPLYTHPAPQVAFSDTQEEIEARLADQLENSCPHCGGSGHKDDVTAPQVAVPEGWAIRRDENGQINFEAPNGARGCLTRPEPREDEPLSSSTIGRAFFDLCSDLLAAAPTEPADEKAQQAWKRFQSMLHPDDPAAAQQPVSDPDGLEPGLAAEAAKHLTSWLDMDLCDCEDVCRCGRTHVRACRDRLLEAAAAPAPDEREIAARAIGSLADRYRDMPPGWWRSDDASSAVVVACEDEIARLRAGKEGEPS
ncbi:hypothetical protein BN2364_4012 [Alloalcanivorax xenomutans]|uniref:hypothetical protein n=1 Tax=Alloalcanivorax xenomutans TaxID=1094342 RepID=UPI0006D5C8B8|nr:hypothetical protein [Alloalcanivorax xenomutans]CUR48453.1 hypothetical protein BN2364_4012 [Alloalcanivorax xenomutans]